MKIYIHHCNLKFERTLVSLLKDDNELYGSLSTPEETSSQQMEQVSIVDSSAIKEALLKVDAVVYRLDKNNLTDVKRAIKILEGSDYAKSKYFILVSSTMSWSMTRKTFVDDEQDDEKQPDQDDVSKKLVYREYEEFTEDVSMTRKPHPNFTGFMEVEKRLLRAESKTLRPFLLFSGIMYGDGEVYLHPWFKSAWMSDNSIPCLGHGENYVPMIHIFDCAQIVGHLLQMSTDDNDLPKYIFAVDEGMNKLKDIVAAVQKEFLVGCVEKVTGDEMLLHDHADEFTSDVKMKPGVIEEFDIEWRYREGFVKNIRKVRKEYEKKRNLSPLKVCVLGAPASGKTSIAAEVSKHYKLLHITLGNTITEFFAQEDAVQAELNERERQKEEAKNEILRAKQLAKELKQKKKEAKEEEEDGEEEGDEEEGDEEEDPISKELQRKLKQLASVKSMVDKDRPWKLTDHAIAIIIQWKLEQPECRNKGWVLDGFPKSIRGCKELLQKIKIKVNEEGEEEEVEEEEEIEEEEGYEEEDGSALPRAHHLYFPEYIIALHAANDLLLEERVMGMEPSPAEKEKLQIEMALTEEYRSQTQVSKKDAAKKKKSQGVTEQPMLHSSQDNFMRRLKEYKQNFSNTSNIPDSPSNGNAKADNDDDDDDDDDDEQDGDSEEVQKFDKSGVLTFMEEVQITERYQASKFTLIKDIAIKDNAKETRHDMEEVIRLIGEPHNFGLTLEEEQELERLAAEKKRLQKEQEDQERQAQEEQERQERETRRQLLEEHEKRIKDVKEQERQMLEVKSEPMRKYLMKNVLPVLTKGLIEVCQTQPEDPVDYLAEWLFRYNMHEE